MTLSQQWQYLNLTRNSFSFSCERLQSFPDSTVISSRRDITRNYFTIRAGTSKQQWIN